MLQLLFDVAVFAGGFVAGGYFKGNAASMMAAAKAKWETIFQTKDE